MGSSSFRIPTSAAQETSQQEAIAALQANSGIYAGLAATAFGDSITSGSGPSSPDKAYIPLLAAALGWDITNTAHAGDSLSITAASHISPAVIDSDSISILLSGINDLMGYGKTDSAASRSTYAEILLAAAIRLGLPTAKLISANGVTKVGSWSSDDAFSDGIDYAMSATGGDTLSTVLYGTTLYVGFIHNPNLSAGKFKVTVDGVDYPVVDCAATVQAAYSSILTPAAIRIGGLLPGRHEVAVTLTDSSGNVYIQYFASNDQVAGAGPRAYIGSILHVTEAQYILEKYPLPSDATVAAWNAISERAIADLRADGLFVRYVDLTNYFNPNEGDTVTGGIHPSDQGSQHIRDGFEAAIRLGWNAQDNYSIEKVRNEIAALLASGTQTRGTLTYADAQALPITSWQKTLGTAGDTAAGAGIRVIHAAASISTSGKQVRVAIYAPVGGSVLSHVCFAEHAGDGAAAGAFGGPKFKELLFGGSPGINEAGIIQSDWLDFDVDETKEYMTVIAVSGAGTTGLQYNGTTGEGTYEKAAANTDYNSQAISGYTNNAASTYFVYNVQVRTPSRAKLDLVIGPLTDAQIGPSASVALVLSGAAVAPDFSLGNFFTLTLDGTDTLNNPTGAVVNQMGAIVIRQPAAGGKTLAYGTHWLFQGGVKPIISVGANAVDILYFHVLSGTEISCNIVQGIA